MVTGHRDRTMKGRVMNTTAGRRRRALGGIGPWLRLFAAISGGAVAIAVALGLLVVLTSTVAQAQTRSPAGAPPEAPQA